MRYIAVVILLVLRLGFAQEIPDSLRTQGLELLKAAQVEPDKIVDAAKLLALAADAFAAAGKEADAEEMNSCLYWAKKKMTIQQIDAFLGKGNGTAKATIAKLEAVEKQEVKVEDAGKWLAKADGYAEAAKDPFLAAVRYFEVASRFKGSPEGEQALEKSLKFLQQAKVAIPVTNKVVGAAVKGDGKVYVQSNPVGASILVEAEDGLRDTGSKTPSLVQLPKGNAVLVLRKEKYEDQKVSVQIGDAIVKTDVAVLEKPKFDVDIIAEGFDGFMVFIDGKPIADKTGRQAIAPCTVRLPSGNSMLGLAKEGFQDVVQRVTVKETGMEQVKVRGKAVGGVSRIILENKLTLQKKFIGTWVAYGRKDGQSLEGKPVTLVVSHSNSGILLNETGTGFRSKSPSVLLGESILVVEWIENTVITFEYLSSGDAEIKFYFKATVDTFKPVIPSGKANCIFLARRSN